AGEAATDGAAGAVANAVAAVGEATPAGPAAGGAAGRVGAGRDAAPPQARHSRAQTRRPARPNTRRRVIAIPRRPTLLDADDDLGGFDDRRRGHALRQAEAFGRSAGDGGGNLLAVAEVERDLGHHLAERDRDDRALELVASAQPHSPLLSSHPGGA